MSVRRDHCGDRLVTSGGAEAQRMRREEPAAAGGPCVAVVRWHAGDELSAAIADELEALGYRVRSFAHDADIPGDADAVLTFGPYGRLLPIARAVGARPPRRRPLLAHWNFEASPHPRLPWSLISRLSIARARLDHVRALERRMHRWRYLGEYLVAHRCGWLALLATVSPLIARRYSEHDLPTCFIPWGTSPQWFDTLHVPRDIDVLWMGKRRTPRRGGLIDRVRAALERRGVRWHVADGVEQPFIFGAERTRLLNRAKIMLNVKSSPHANGFTFRFHMAAGNRSLVVSEAFVPQSAFYEPGVHFAAAPPEHLAETILYYLDHERERAALADNAYRLVTGELTLRNSVRQFMHQLALAAAQRRDLRFAAPAESRAHAEAAASRT